MYNINCRIDFECPRLVGSERPWAASLRKTIQMSFVPYSGMKIIFREKDEEVDVEQSVAEAEGRTPAPEPAVSPIYRIQDVLYSEDTQQITVTMSDSFLTHDEIRSAVSELIETYGFDLRTSSRGLMETE